tara:strand:- start:257 stop:445 length:189 start_codon:yes stop_codon:yes gene_type:complete
MDENKGKIRYGAGGAVYYEKPVEKKEEVKPVEKEKPKKKKKVIQEIMGDDLKENKETLDEII